MNRNRIHKQTKKDIFAQFGIEYKSGKILSPVFGWINPLLVNGNEKIGKGCYHFSTLPTNKLFTFVRDGITYNVSGTCPCHCLGCYATKGNYNFISVKVSLGIKTYLSYHYLDFVYRAIMAQIKADKITICRIHVAGDFFSIAYIDMWHNVIKNNPGTIFWTYTKNGQAENAFDDLHNMNVVKSIIPGKGFNFGHCDYILGLYEFLRETGKKVYICKCGIDKNQHCVNCGACRTCDYVLFLEHSTEYKAEQDKLFPVLMGIIESQKEITLS